MIRRSEFQQNNQVDFIYAKIAMYAITSLNKKCSKPTNLRSCWFTIITRTISATCKPLLLISCLTFQNVFQPHLLMGEVQRSYLRGKKTALDWFPMLFFT